MDHVSTKNFEYDVALSFAGEDRGFVEDVAEGLAKEGIKFFYDDMEQDALLGKNLVDFLDGAWTGHRGQTDLEFFVE
jgi:hypothetical protein